MAPRRRRISPLPPSAPISIGNCEVVVEAKNFTSELNRDTVQISLSKTARIRVSVVEKVNNHDDPGLQKMEQHVDCYFVLANPKNSDDQTKCLLQEVVALYMSELPAMKYAANTGKQSMFLERCVTNGKYCTLIMKSKDGQQAGEVIAAITYQIIPADTQYAEVPLAAVNSRFQCKGIGRLLYLELCKRLQSVGICTLFCWGDKESEGFWLKQGFKGIGVVDKKGRAHRLPVKADIRKALCFPGGSTLMVSHLLKDNSSKPLKFVKLCLPIKSPELNCENQDLERASESHELPKEIQVAEGEYFEPEKLLVDYCQDAGLWPITGHGNVTNNSGIRGGSEDENNCSCSPLGSKKRVWEATCTSLKSKKVKGKCSTDCQISSDSPVRTCNGRKGSSLDGNSLSTSRNEFPPDALLMNSGNNNMCENAEGCRAGSIANENLPGTAAQSAAKLYRIMLMNIADDDKKLCLTKIIEDLGGVVTSEGSVSTHIVTGKVRKTLNFCTALCSGAWVISSGWLKESFKKGSFVDEMPFILLDDEYRNKYRTELKSAVLRAKASPSALLKGLDIWPAKHIQPPTNTLSAIVKSAGGNVIRAKDEVKDASRTVFVACEEDMEEAMLAIKLGIWTFSSDWLMNCVMRQELDFDAPQFAESL